MTWTRLRVSIPAGGNPQAAGRIYGSVYFTDASGNAVQPMQGVNVVARLMVAGQPSPAVRGNVRFRVLVLR
jgi:hypothetical protein